MPDGKLIGANYIPPDHVAKVTGRAKYAEDFRADGMLFAKLLLSPMPHARVRGIDTSAALAIPGVRAILTADEVPDLNGAEKALTNEPLYAGEPILAVAAVERRDRGNGHRSDPGGSRAASLRRRSARQPPARRPQRAVERQRVGRTASTGSWRTGSCSRASP